MKFTVVGNWKNIATSRTVNALCNFNFKKMTKIDVHLCPGELYIRRVKKKININVGLQNVHINNHVITGEPNKHIKNKKYSICLVGHSERRVFTHETTKIIREKLKRLVKNKIRPILCVGNEHEHSEEVDVVLKQLSDITIKLNKKYLNFDVAYEPIYAIGTKCAKIKNIDLVTAEIKNKMVKLGITGVVMYGGSINTENCVKIAKIKNVAGFLIENASLSADFIEICKKLETSIFL